MNRKKKYTIGWYVICALMGICLPITGHAIISWQYWLLYILFMSGAWCSLNMGMEN